MQQKWAGYLAGWLCTTALSIGCSAPEAEIVRLREAVLGQSGDHTVSGQEVVNKYGVLAANVGAGSKVISIRDLSTLSGLQAGDVLFLIQMQGAAIDLLSDASRYGDVLDIRNAGHYEMVTVTAVDAATSSVQIRSRGPGGLQFDYTATGHTQVIYVPQYKNLTVPTGGTLAAMPWNGQVGGVVVVTADTLQVDGAISAVGMGFQGGQHQNGVSAVNYPGYRTTDATISGARGEGVGGGASDFTSTGGFGRGAAGNGGGGGNNINCPGGGGANALAMGKTWTGQGVMDVSQAGYRTAWMLDPAYDATNQLFADSAGGGRGGYGCSAASADPLTTAPGAAAWGCGNRPNLGGLGGRPLLNDVRNRLFLGGGGGAGQANQNNGGSGGNGGGLVFVLARTIQGQGSVSANGAPGGTSGLNKGTTSDAPGGGGGGGSVVLMATENIGSVVVSAAGGVGGEMQTGSNPLEGEGAGGGGGGGFVALVGQTSIQPVISGGAAGRITTASFATFPMDGATGGGGGAISPVKALSPDFLPPVYASDIQVTLGLGATKRPGYTQVPVYANYTNLGPDPAANVKAMITIPAGFTGVQTRSGNFACTQQGQVVSCTLPALGVNETEVIEIFLTLPPQPQGPFNIDAAVSGGGFDYVTANNQATLAAEIEGEVQLAGNGFGCTMNGRATRSSAAGWSLLIVAGLLLAMRRRSARALVLLGGLLSACSPPVKSMLAVQITVNGQGSVASSDATIACGAQCQTMTDPGILLLLKATPDSGQRFVRWDGRCQGTVPTCDLSVLNDVQATATFEPIAATCSDGIKNAGETDVDCGGSCSPCEDGRSCAAMGDCQSAQCVTGLCTSCPIGKELIINGGAEVGPAPTTYLAGWQVNPQIVGLAYGTAGFPATTDPGPAQRGTYFFYGNSNPTATATQGIDLRACATLIDKGVLTYALSGYFGGFPGQDDNARFDIVVQDSQPRAKSTAQVGPVLNSDRAGASALLMRSTAGAVLPGSRYVIATLTCTRTAGISNDGYADNLSFILNLTQP